MKYLGYIIAVIILVVSLNQKTETKIIYKKGETIIDSIYVPFGVEKIVYKERIKYKRDSIFIRDTLYKVVKSTFNDSTDKYNLTVNAFAPLAVISFNYDLTIKEKIITKTRIDTLEFTTNIPDGFLDTKGEAMLGLGALLLGLIL